MKEIKEYKNLKKKRKTRCMKVVEKDGKKKEGKVRKKLKD